jgi:hypothetical protein
MAPGSLSDAGVVANLYPFASEGSTEALTVLHLLIALGGGVLTGFMAMIFQAIGIDVEPFFESWLLPCSASAFCAGADRARASNGGRRTTCRSTPCERRSS